MDNSYEAPAIADLGSFAEKTMDRITKTAGSGDVISIDGVDTPVPGGTVISTS